MFQKCFSPHGEWKFNGLLSNGMLIRWPFLALNSVRITTAGPSNSTLEGTLFTACTITNLVAINTSPVSTADAKQAQSGDYHVIPISRIQNFQLLALPSNSSESPSFADAQPGIQALDTRALKAREIKAVGDLLERESRRGKGVTREAQDIFDAFSRTTPTRWDGQNIIVADTVVIAAPYRQEDCRPLAEGNDAAVARVRKVVSKHFSSSLPIIMNHDLTQHSLQLEMERKKMEFRTASATIGSTNTFTRNSGDQRKGG